MHGPIRRGVLLSKNERNLDGFARSLGRALPGGGAGRGWERWRPSCGRSWSGGCGTWASPPSPPSTPRYGASLKPCNKPPPCQRGTAGSGRDEVLSPRFQQKYQCGSSRRAWRNVWWRFLVALTLPPDPPPFPRSLRSGSPTSFP